MGLSWGENFTTRVPLWRKKRRPSSWSSPIRPRQQMERGTGHSLSILKGCTEKCSIRVSFNYPSPRPYKDQDTEHSWSQCMSSRRRVAWWNLFLPITIRAEAYWNSRSIFKGSPTLSALPASILSESQVQPRTYPSKLLPLSTGRPAFASSTHWRQKQAHPLPLAGCYLIHYHWTSRALNPVLI